MKSLLLAITFMFISLIAALAQSNPPAPSYNSNSKIVELPSVNSPNDSLLSAREREWNKHLIINSDSRIDTLIQIHKEENIRKKGIDGYRVQIFQGTKEEAYQVEARFISLHEGIETHVEFPDPYFTVRIGDFRTKSEAIKLKQQIKSEYPSSYIVDCTINLPELQVADAGK